MKFIHSMRIRRAITARETRVSRTLIAASPVRHTL